MRGATRPSNDDFQPALLGGRRIFKKQVGGPVGRDDAGLMRNTKTREDVRGMLHGLPIRCGTHDDADERIGVLAVELVIHGKGYFTAFFSALRPARAASNNDEAAPQDRASRL